VSFDLAVWASPAPVTVDEAAAEHERLCSAAAVVGVDAPHSAVVAFHRALTDLHPDLTAAALAADERAGASPWSELSLTASAVLMAVSWRRAEEIAALVGELAAQHGLTLYDPQRRTVRSPVGAAPTPVLTQCDGTTWTDPDARWVERAVRRLDERNWFAVLERADGHYVQAGCGEQVGLGPGRYVLEYREGAPQTHHRAESGEVGAVVSAFQRFARGDSGWSEGIGWARCEPRSPGG
jgi:hypothetical protein